MVQRSPVIAAAIVAFLTFANPSCKKSSDTSPQGPATVTTTVESTQFITREHFMASGEMQTSGEPFAESMGRDLRGYSRVQIPPNLYTDPNTPKAPGVVDLPGFATAIESYEYSKQPMNNVAFESGAGTSLVYGPLANANNLSGTAATQQLATLVQQFATESNALGSFVFPAGTYPARPTAVDTSGNCNPSGAGTGAENPLGWPGIWPTVHVFAQFDPTVNPAGTHLLYCSISSDDNPGAASDPEDVASGALASSDYECDYTSSNLPDRSTQVTPVVTPGADGFSGWKYGLWVLNYLQVMHDSAEDPISAVDPNDLSLVGTLGNGVVGVAAGSKIGTYLGSSNIEGFQAQMFIEEVDNRAQDWLMNLSTSDGATLNGFGAIANASAYNYTSPLRWFPASIAVTESNDNSGFPKPSYALASANSALLDQIGMLMGYAEFLAITDTNNADVGGSQPCLAVFDGDPFPADDPLADGQSTLHDRALAIIRVVLVNMDRMHGDPTTGILVDDVTMNGNSIARGATVSATSVAYSVLGLRTALRALSSQLELYSNNTPDTAVVSTPIDAAATYYPGGTSMTGRLQAMLATQGNLLYDHLTTASGVAYAGWNVASGSATDDGNSLDAHTAAIRGLFSMYFATGNVKYRTRAMAVYQRLDSVFYDPSANVYTTSPGPMASVVFTPLRFALVESTLRDVYEIVASQPGGGSLGPTVLQRLARLNKLVLNGWDDRNDNTTVDWPQECTNVQDGLPRGGLQMAERTLSGETGSAEEAIRLGGVVTPTFDREHDCVPEIDDAHLPAALAAQITLHISY